MCRINSGTREYKRRNDCSQSISRTAKLYLITFITYYGQGISTDHLGIPSETSPRESLDFLGRQVWLMGAVMVGVTEKRLASENIFHTLADMGDIRYRSERLEWSIVSRQFKQHKRYVDNYGLTNYDNAIVCGDCREVIDKGKALRQGSKN
jgi:hypothetical protein